MINKSVIIIGGGVSGLSTAIYLKRHGYDVTVLEKNATLGGACIGWVRRGCYIDGCIHWLVGTKKGTKTRELWEEVGALTPESEIYDCSDFYTLDFGDGKRFTVWADLEKMREEFYAFAPEDKRQIDKFCALIKRFQKIDAPVEKPTDLMNIGELLKIGLTMATDYYYVKKYSSVSCAEYAKKFKNPYIRKWLEEHMSAGYNLMSFLYMIAHVSKGDGGIPVGGSLALVERMRDTLLALGGRIRCSAEVSRIDVEDGRCVGVTLKSGESLRSDWTVSAAPAVHTLKELLSDKYALKKIDMRLADRRTYPIYTYTTAVFKINADTSSYPLSEKIYFDEPITLDKENRSVVYRNYSYDKTLKSTEGNTIIQATVSGNDDTYFWWKNVKKSGQYEQKKSEIAKKMLDIYAKKYPELEGKIEIIDVVTPLTYQRYLNGRHGSFQAFVQTSRAKRLMQRGEIKGLSGFILSGQWILMSGGLPTAAITGRFAAQRICRHDGVEFIRNNLKIKKSKKQRARALKA